MNDFFRDKTVIVTGASSGIGRETALAFVKAGARVVLAARSESELRALIDEHPAAPDRLLAVPTDVTQDADVQRLIAATIARFGRIDILVNNAGIGLRAPVTEMRPEDARRVMEVNFFGVVRCTQAVLPHLTQQPVRGTDGIRGQIVNVGSILSLIATPKNSLYSASKFAVRAFSDALRMELRSQGIDVILIMPGYTATPFFENMSHAGSQPRTTKMKGQHPRRVADAILRACRRRQREVVLPLHARAGSVLKRVSPRMLDFVLSRGRWD